MAASVLRFDRLDHSGFAEILKSGALAGAVHGIAEQIAGSARQQQPDAEVVVDDYVTDRAASSVTVKDVRAMGWVAADGLLIRDAASSGLEVTG